MVTTCAARLRTRGDAVGACRSAKWSIFSSYVRGSSSSSSSVTAGVRTPLATRWPRPPRARRRRSSARTRSRPSPDRLDRLGLPVEMAGVELPPGLEFLLLGTANCLAWGVPVPPRPAYRREISAAEAGEIDVILSYSNSRLTRRPLELEHLINLQTTT